MPFVALSLCVSCTKTKPEAHPYATTDALKSPVIFGGNVISTELPEFATSFSRDGKTAFFNVASPDRKTLRIAHSQYTNNSWSEPAPLPFSDGTYADVDPFVSPDGSRLYFSSNRPMDDNDSIADFDTWYVERRNNDWGEPVNPVSL